MEVVLSVSHAMCPSRCVSLGDKKCTKKDASGFALDYDDGQIKFSNHLCDTGAANMAMYISKALSDLKITNQVLLGDVSRDVCDLNRTPCRDTMYRKRLRETLAKSGNKAYLLDIHSFNEDAEDFIDSEIVLLDESPDPHKVWPFTYSLYSFLKTSGITTKILKGKHNDINIEATEKLLAPVFFLIERNEAVSGSRAEEIAKLVAKWLSSSLLSHPHLSQSRHS